MGVGVQQELESADGGGIHLVDDGSPRLGRPVPFGVAGPLASHHRLDIASQAIQLLGRNDLAQDHVSVREQLFPFWVHARFLQWMWRGAPGKAGLCRIALGAGCRPELFLAGLLLAEKG